MVPVCIHPAGASVKQPPGYYELSGKPHGTHICVPYKPAENNKQIIVQQGRGMPRPRFYGDDNLRIGL